MKKIFILLFFILLLSGCYDYKELNDLTYISAFGLDYKDNNYIVYYEVLNNKKDSDSIKKETKIISASAASLTEAFYKITEKLDKTVFFSHSKLLIVSEDFAKSCFKDSSDFLLRNPKIYEEFYVVVTSDEIEKVLNVKDDTNPVASEKIVNLIETNDYSENISIDTSYSKLISLMDDKKKETAISMISINNNSLEISGIALFKEYNFYKKENNEFANFYNLILNKDKKMMLETNIDNSLISLEIILNKNNIKVTDNEININLTFEGEIKSDVINFNLEDEKNYLILSDKISKELENKVYNFVLYTKENDIDLFGFQDYYYKQNRKENNSFWKNSKINVNVKTNIIKKGIIYNVQN